MAKILLVSTTLPLYKMKNGKKKVPALTRHQYLSSLL